MSANDKNFGLSPLVPVPWAAIRAWLDSAEQMQSTAHLSHAQILALSRFANFIDEPEVPKEDHVSKLLRMSPAVTAAAAASRGREVVFANNGVLSEHTQGKHLGNPAFEMGEPVDVPHKGAFQLRWHCQCVLPWCGQTFPRVEEGRPPPLFMNKKDAKQFAAMQAVAFLTGSIPAQPSHTPHDTPRKTPQAPAQQIPPPQTVPVPLPALAQPVPSQSAAAQSAPQAQPVIQPQPILQQQPVAPPSTPAQPSTPNAIHLAPDTPPSVGNRPKRPLESPTIRENPRSPLKQRHDAPTTPNPPLPSSPTGKQEAAAEQSRLFDLIARRASRLGISQPQYRLTQDPERANFFKGHAEFSVASRVPDGIAVVDNVLGKKQARIQIAEKVLKWLEEEEQRRQELVNGILG